MFVDYWYNIVRTFHEGWRGWPENFASNRCLNLRYAYKRPSRRITRSSVRFANKIGRVERTGRQCIRTCVLYVYRQGPYSSQIIANRDPYPSHSLNFRFSRPPHPLPPPVVPPPPLPPPPPKRTRGVRFWGNGRIYFRFSRHRTRNLSFSASATVGMKNRYLFDGIRRW